MTVAPRALPGSIDDTAVLLAAADYVAERSLATAVFLALKLARPLFLEGEAGVGKTEIAKVLAATLDRPPRATAVLRGSRRRLGRVRVELRAADDGDPPGRSRRRRLARCLAQDLFSERFMIRRPVLQAWRARRAACRCC